MRGPLTERSKGETAILESGSRGDGCKPELSTALIHVVGYLDSGAGILVGSAVAHYDMRYNVPLVCQPSQMRPFLRQVSPAHTHTVGSDFVPKLTAPCVTYLPRILRLRVLDTHLCVSVEQANFRGMDSREDLRRAMQRVAALKVEPMPLKTVVALFHTYLALPTSSNNSTHALRRPLHLPSVGAGQGVGRGRGPDRR